MLNKTSGIDPKLIKKAYAKAEKIKKQKVFAEEKKYIIKNKK